MRTLTNDTDFYVGVDGMVYSNGYEECEPGHFYGPAVRRSWLIHYITEGKGTFCCQGKCWKLTKGDLFFCRPGVEIEYHADQDDPWAYGWIGLQGTRMPEYFARTSLMETPVAHYDQDDQLALLFVKVQEAYKCPPEIRDLRLNSLLYSLLEFLVQTFPTAKASQVSNEKRIVAEFVNYISTHINHSIVIADMCKELGVSRSYGSRLFSTYQGISLRDFIWQSKESEAKRMLETTDLSIQIIAYSLGYEDPLYFSRLFRQKTGLSCTQWRQGQRLHSHEASNQKFSG